MRHGTDRYGLEVDWGTMGEYMARLEKQGVSLNVAPLVGHNQLRASVMGFDKRPPTHRARGISLSCKVERYFDEDRDMMSDIQKERVRG